MFIYTYVLHYYKVSENSVERFQRSCTDKLFFFHSFILVKFLSSKRVQFQEKNWNTISCGYAFLHIMSFITTKFHEIMLSGLRGIALTTCFSSIFHFCQIFKFREKKLNKISCGYAHLHIMSFITTKFQKILSNGFRGVALTNCFFFILSFWLNF